MKRQLLIFSALVLLSAGLGAAVYVINNPVVNGIFYTSVVLTAAYLFFPIIFGRFLIWQITDLKTRYTAKKAISILSIVFIITLCLRIWVTDTSSLFLSYGIIGAGIAFALQDVFKNFVGGFLIMIHGMYRVGDRISIDDKFGDVMDIGVMNTTMMETQGWGSGDQPSGRLLIIPNGLVTNHSLYNYTGDHSFIWDEISIPLTYDSDWRRAKDVILSIIRTETDAMTKQAEVEIERLGEKYYLPKRVVEPAVYISFTDNWIVLDARYVTEARCRRILRSRLSELILAAIEMEDRITISSATMTVTTIDETPASRKDQKKQPDDHS